MGDEMGDVLIDVALTQGWELTFGTIDDSFALLQNDQFMLRIRSNSGEFGEADIALRNGFDRWANSTIKTLSLPALWTKKDAETFLASLGDLMNQNQQNQINRLCDNFTTRELLGLLTGDEFRKIYMKAKQFMEWDEFEQSSEF